MKDLIFFQNERGAIIPSKREEDGWYDIYPCFCRKVYDF